MDALAGSSIESITRYVRYTETVQYADKSEYTVFHSEHLEVCFEDQCETAEFFPWDPEDVPSIETSVLRQDD